MWSSLKIYCWYQVSFKQHPDKNPVLLEEQKETYRAKDGSKNLKKR